MQEVSDSIRYTSEPPTAEAAKAAGMLEGRYTAEQWEVLAKNSLFVTVYHDEILIGISHTHGNGVDWTVEQYFVCPDYRQQGIGTELRKRTHQLCVDNTLVGGKIRGVVKSSRNLWLSLPGSRIIRMYNTLRTIEHKLDVE